MKSSVIVPTLASLTLLLTACGTTTGLSPETMHSGFDNARVVHIQPHSNAPNGALNMFCTGIGAQWSEANKNDVVLIIAVFNMQTSIVGAELNIDGQKLTLSSLHPTTDMNAGGDIMKTSTRTFFTNLSTVEKIIKSKRTWLRVQTATGSLENAVIDGDKDSKAYHALIRFMASVKNEKQG